MMMVSGVPMCVSTQCTSIDWQAGLLSGAR
jgi:hypothetical protein